MSINTRKHKERYVGSRLTLILLLTFVVINLILPLFALLQKSVDFEPFYSGFTSVLSRESTQTAIANSLVVTLISASLAVVAAYFYAYVTEFKLKGSVRSFFRIFAILTMLVPSVTHGIVIVYLFGRTGLFTRLLGLNINIYGRLGIIMGSFFYAFPAAFLIFSQAFANMDGRLFDTTKVLGCGPVRRFFDITLPITRYPIYSAFSVCFTMIFTDYGVPISVGGNYSTLSILFYKNVIGRLDFATGAIYSVFLLIPAVIVYLLDIFVFSKKSVAGKDTGSLDTGKFLVWQKFVYAVLTFIVILCLATIVLVPFVSNWPYDMSFTLSHFSSITRNGRLFSLWRNSLLIAGGTAVLGTILAFSAGYLYTRTGANEEKIKKFNHALYTITLAVPGLALGLAYALFFRGSAIYNTIWILIIVNTLHFFGSPYMMSISHFKQLDPNLENVCASLGGTKRRTMQDVIIPSSRRLVIDIFSYFFTNSMITISAVSLLYTSRTITMAVQVTALSDQGASEAAVAVSLVILLTNLFMKFIQLFMDRDKRFK